MLRPSTAEKLLETTRTSSTDSVLGVRFVMPPRATPFVLVSSTVYEFASSRCPLALMRGADSPAKESSAPPPPLMEADTPLPVTPGCSAIRLYKLRPLSGISWSCSRSTRPETRPCSVSTTGACRRDGHVLLDARHVQGEVEAHGFADPHGDAVPLRGQEARLQDPDAVGAGPEAEDAEHAFRRGDRLTRHATLECA